jgi:hypothetical protein
LASTTALNGSTEAEQFFTTPPPMENPPEEMLMPAGD